MSSRVSIVILNWNGRHYLEKFLPSLLSGTEAGAELVVIDNASTDDSLAFLQSHYPQVRIIRNRENFGFARGYNEGLREVEAEYLVLLNSDVEVAPGWLTPLLQLMDSRPDIGACQPKLLQYDQRNLFEYAGASGGWLDYLGYPFARGRIFDYCEEDQGQYDDTAPVFWASGAALLVRNRLFKELGGFDPYFFAHQEEIDLCWRIQLSGYKIYSCPSSVVHHVGGGTLPKNNSKKTYLNFRNNRIMLSKNLPFYKKLWVMPVRSFLDGVSALKGLFSGDGGYFIAITRAHLAFLKWWLLYQDKSVFPKTKKKNLSGYLPKNIAWLHFVKKKKYFPEIVGNSD